MRSSRSVENPLAWGSLLACALAGVLSVASVAEAVELTRLTFTGRDENWSTWAPNGFDAMFSSGESICDDGVWFCGPQNLWSIRFDGDQVLSLELFAKGAYHPRMSPDGQWVACMRHNGDDWDIWVWPAGRWDLGQPFQSLAGFQERFPNWSNDSQYLAFDSDRPSDLGTTGYQVYFAPIASFDDPAQAVQVTFLGSNNKHPTWSADDGEIAYVGDAADRRSISAVRLSDGRYRRITPHESQNRHPDWSPDGRWIALTTDRWDGIGDIAIVDARGGGEVVRVTVGMDGHDDFPEWSPDSRRILFCGSVSAPPYQPNKEIFVASDLPFESAAVPTVRETVSGLKGSWGRSRD